MISTFRLLFAIDEKFDVSLKDIDGEPGIFFSDKNLIQFLKDWQGYERTSCIWQSDTGQL